MKIFRFSLDFSSSAGHGEHDVQGHETRVFLRGAVAGFGGRIVSLASNLVATAIIARRAGAQELGIYAIGVAVVAYISLLTSLQLSQQIARSRSEQERAGLAIWAPVVGVAGVVAVGAAALVGWRLWSISPGVLMTLLPLVAIQPTLDATVGWLVNTGQIRSATLLQTFRAVLRPLLVLVFALVLARITAITIALIDSVIGIVALIAILLKLTSEGVRRVLRARARVAFRSLVFSSFSLIAMVAGWQMMQRTDLLAVGVWRGSSAAGQYTAALRFPETLETFFSSIMMYFVPAVAVHASPKRRREAYIRATILGAYLIIPPLIITGFWGDVLVKAVFGESYVVSFWVYFVISVGLAFQVSAGPNGAVLVASRRNRALVTIGIALFVVNLALNVALVPSLGLLGASLASSASFMCVNFLYAFSIRGVVGRYRIWNSVSKREVAYITALGAISSVPRLFFGPSGFGMALACVFSLIFVIAAMRTRLVHPVMVDLKSALSRGA